MAAIDILYVQRSDVLAEQEPRVLSRLREAFTSARVVFASSPTDVPLGSTFDAIIAPTVPWLPDLLSRLSNRPHLHFQSAGVDRLWEMPFEKTEYTITKSSGVHAVPMSEFAIGAMLYFTKSFPTFAEQSRRREWRRFWLHELAEKDLLILGLGQVGTAVANRATAFGMRVTAIRSTPGSVPGIEHIAPLSDLGLLLPQADYVVVTLPLTDETRGVIDHQSINVFKEGSILVDISRGGIVAAEAVVNALDHGPLRGAALDVFETEPLPTESPLWDRPDVLVTPHVSGTTPQYLERVLDAFIASAGALARGDRPPNLVDLTKGY